MKKQNINIIPGRRKWYIATVIGCFLVPVGLVWNIFNTVDDFRHRRDRNPAILYSAFGAMLFSMFMGGYVAFFAWMDDDGIQGIAPLIIYYLLALVLAAYLFIVYGFHTRRSRYLTGIYSLIRSDHITSVPMIAEIMGIDRAKTIHHLQTLIRMGYLKNAHLDEKQEEILLHESLWARQLVVCQSCGAGITVNFGQTLVCEYCGGALKVKRVL